MLLLGTLSTTSVHGIDTFECLLYKIIRAKWNPSRPFFDKSTQKLLFTIHRCLHHPPQPRLRTHRFRLFCRDGFHSPPGRVVGRNHCWSCTPRRRHHPLHLHLCFHRPRHRCCRPNARLCLYLCLERVVSAWRCYF